MKILFILPHTIDPYDPKYLARFEDISHCSEGHALITSDTESSEITAGKYIIHNMQAPQVSGPLGALKTVFFLVKHALRLARKYKVDLVYTYDPLTLGIVATITKILAGAASVIEVNGHLKDAADARLGGAEVSFIKRKLFNLTCSTTLFFAEAVKILNNDQFDDWRLILKNKPCFMFTDYIPVSKFTRSQEDKGYILCLGYPFKRKGVDILLEAFEQINQDFPEIRLKIMGYCPEPERSMWQKRIDKVAGAELQRPVVHAEIEPYFQECTLLVLPSRSEGMGRVLIEAMACGKPIVGSRVGGIPNIIKDHENGRLFETENSEDLARVLRSLLEHPEVMEEIGEAGYQLTQTTFNEKQYGVNFEIMVTTAVSSQKRAEKKGTIYNGYSLGQG